MKPYLFALFLASASVLHAKTPQNPAYIAIDLGAHGGTQSYAYGINNAGQIAGAVYTSMEVSAPPRWYAARFDSTNESNGFYWTPQNAIAYSINDSNQLVGRVTAAGGDSAQAVSFDWAGNVKNLGSLGGQFPNSTAYSINNLGQSVGVVISENGGYSKAVRFNSDAPPTDLGGAVNSYAFGINDSGQIVGQNYLITTTHATLFSLNGPPTDLGVLGNDWYASSRAYAINNSGQIVGASQVTRNGYEHATLFSLNGPPTDLGTLGGNNSVARAINESGQIVGHSNTIGSGTDRGFLYSGGVMSNVNDLIQPGSGITNIIIYGHDAINDWGQIAAQGTVGGQLHAVLLNPVNPLTSTTGTSSNVKFLSGMGYDKFAAATNPGGGGTSVDFLGGTAGSGSAVAGRNVTVAFTGADNTGLASDIVNVSGTSEDIIVLSLSYNAALFGDKVALGWRNTNTNEWILAVNENTGGGGTFIKGPYDPTQHFHLGYHGVDTATNTVWAVINHNSDFAAISSAPASEPTTIAPVDPRLVSAWKVNRTDAVLVFRHDGYFYQVQDSPSGSPGFEYGLFQWDPASGGFTVDVEVDTNGEHGFSHPADGPATVTVSENTLTYTVPGEGVYTATRIVNAVNGLTGSWFVPGEAFSLTFLSDGTYYFTDQDAGDADEHDGAEYGTYTWNPTTRAIAFTPVKSTLDHGPASFPADATATIIGNRLTLVFDGETEVFQRIDRTTNPVNDPDFEMGRDVNYTQTSPSSMIFADYGGWAAIYDAASHSSPTLKIGGNTPRAFSLYENDWEVNSFFPSLAALNHGTTGMPDGVSYVFGSGGGAATLSFPSGVTFPSTAVVQEVNEDDGGGWDSGVYRLDHGGDLVWTGHDNYADGTCFTMLKVVKLSNDEEVMDQLLQGDVKNFRFGPRLVPGVLYEVVIEQIKLVGTTTSGTGPFAGKLGHAVTIAETRLIVDYAGPEDDGPVVFTDDLQSRTVALGEDVLLSVGIEGRAGAICQWFKDGVEIPGQTGTSLAIFNFKSEDYGDYHLEMTDIHGKKESTVAVLSEDGGGPVEAFEAWASAAGLTGPSADAGAKPFGDGVPNLLKYAFNMNPAGPDVTVLGVGGTHGLPRFTVDEGGEEPVLKVEYLRRKGSGLVYIPERSTALDHFTPMLGSETVTSINAEWERVTVVETDPPEDATRSFARIRVTLP